MPKIHVEDHGGDRKGAKDAARAEVGSGGTTTNHTSPAVGKVHYHGETLSGDKILTHHEYKQRRRVQVGSNGRSVALAGNALLGSALGAYVPVVGVADSEQTFRVGVDRAMAALEFELLDLAEVQQLQSSSDFAALDEVLRERVKSLHVGNPIEFGSFHAFST